MADFPPVASLRSFEAVARLGSVTQAAHELSVTHSAVSQHIKQLEALVGVTLFIRHGRGVRITEEGRLYALQIREALQHIADATRMVQIKPRTLEVTLATLPSFGCHWLLPRLARFQARHPQIAVRLLTSLAVVNLQQEGIDLAIRMGQGDWEGMESRHLFADEQLVVAAPHYRSGDLPTTPQAIAASEISRHLMPIRPRFFITVSDSPIFNPMTVISSIKAAFMTMSDPRSTRGGSPRQLITAPSVTQRKGI